MTEMAFALKDEEGGGGGGVLIKRPRRPLQGGTIYTSLLTVIFYYRTNGQLALLQTLSEGRREEEGKSKK